MLSVYQRHHVPVGAPKRTTILDRHGNHVPLRVDQITERNGSLAVGLDRVHLDKITAKVVNGMFGAMTTADLDELSISTCRDLGLTDDPQYLVLASGIAWSNHVKSTPPRFRDFVSLASHRGIVHPDWAAFCLQEADALEEIMREETDRELNDPIYLRDRYSYVAFTMLLKQYMLKVEQQSQRSMKKKGHVEREEKAQFWVLERPSYMLMRVAVFYFMPDLAAIKRCVQVLFKRYFTPATPVLQYAGTLYPNLNSCFCAGTECLTTTGVKTIETVQVGDQVITHTGAVRTVLQLHTNKLGNRGLYRLQCAHTPAVFVTGNHKVWAISDLNRKARWVAVEDLTSGHHIAVPKMEGGVSSPVFDLWDVLQRLKSVEYRLETDGRYIYDERAHSPLSYHLVITPTVASALGMWFGDGRITAQETLRSVGLVCQAKNKAGVEFWAETMSRATNIPVHWHDSLKSATLPSVLLAEAFAALFGTGFAGKRLHSSMFTWSADLVKQFMRGLMATDGCVARDGTMTVRLHNSALAKEVYHWVRSTGQDISYMQPRKRAAKSTSTLKLPRGWIQPGELLKAYDDERMQQVAAPSPSQRTISLDGQAFVGVDKLEQVLEGLPDLVYTLGVDGDHSYNVEGLVVENCFLWEVDDNLESIMESWSQIARISSRGGGLGGGIGALRPKNSVIHSSQGLTNSIVGWVEMYELIAKNVNQGGRRPGSCALYLPPYHGDVQDFLMLKSPDSGKDDVRCPEIHIALWNPDIFFARLEYWAEHEKEPVMWSLFNTGKYPQLLNLWGPAFAAEYERLEAEGKYMARVPISAIWHLILKALQEKGEPYMHSADTINAKSSHVNIGPIRSSNLCCEIVQYHDSKSIAVCCLASIALPEFVSLRQLDGSDLYGFDFAAYETTIRQLVRNQNQSIDRSEYSREEARQNQELLRSISLGVQGLADVFNLLHLPWSSEEARALNRLLFEHYYFFALDESNVMAQEVDPKTGAPYGPYPGWWREGPNRERPPLRDGKFHWELRGVQPAKMRSATDSCANSDGASPGADPLTRLGDGKVELFPHPEKQRGRRALSVSWKKLDWSGLRLRIQKHGVRNSMVLGLMPTMSTSKVLGWTDSFEPSENIYLFKNQNTSDTVVPNRHLWGDLSDLGLMDTDEQRKAVTSHIHSHSGSIATFPLPADVLWLKDVYRTVYEVAPRTMLELSVDRQHFIDQSKSQNVYMTEASQKKMLSWYILSWRQGLKCNSYYVRTQPADKGHNVAKAAAQLKAPSAAFGSPRLHTVAEAGGSRAVVASSPFGTTAKPSSSSRSASVRPPPVQTASASQLDANHLATPAPQRSPDSAMTPATTKSPVEPHTGRAGAAQCPVDVRASATDCAMCSG